MIRNLKKLLRTAQTCFPWLLDAKFSAMRFTRNTLGIPFENDFNALSLFPQVDGALYLDVGANRGQSTDAILMNRKDIRLQLFEPNELLCERLRSLFCDNKDIVVNGFGLGDEDTQGILVVPVYNGWLFDGLGSFNETEAADWLKGRIFFFDQRFLALRKSRCRIAKLDDLGLAPFFIKLDVQGYELKALRGGERTIVAHEPVLLIESPSDGLVSYLAALGFNLYAFDRGRFVPGIRGAPNTFFMTTKRAALVRNHIAGPRPATVTAVAGEPVATANSICR
jgi:FkbM family methyltransferase